MPIADHGARYQISTAPTSGLELSIAIDPNTLIEIKEERRGRR